jgi:hypothetical protein
MTFGVLYLNLGAKHAVHLIVSLTSLRKHYAGPVAIVTEADGPSLEVARWCQADPALGTIEIIADPTLRAGGHGQSYLCKTLLPTLSPFDATLFIDADTLITGDFREAFPQTADEVTLTHFSDWVSTGSKMSGRISEWAKAEPERAARMLATAWPAINTGVVGWGKDTQAFAADWHATSSKRKVFITDELAAQLIFPDHNVRIVDWRYNASVVFDLDRPNFGDARIVHGHGMKFWKRPTGWQFYRQHYFECLEQNRANIQALRPSDKCLSVQTFEDGVPSKMGIPQADRDRIETYLAVR